MLRHSRIEGYISARTRGNLLRIYFDFYNESFATNFKEAKSKTELFHSDLSTRWLANGIPSLVCGTFTARMWIPIIWSVGEKVRNYSIVQTTNCECCWNATTCTHTDLLRWNIELDLELVAASINFFSLLLASS